MKWEEEVAPSHQQCFLRDMRCWMLGKTTSRFPSLQRLISTISIGIHLISPQPNEASTAGQGLCPQGGNCGLEVFSGIPRQVLEAIAKSPFSDSRPSVLSVANVRMCSLPLHLILTWFSKVKSFLHVRSHSLTNILLPPKVTGWLLPEHKITVNGL